MFAAGAADEPAAEGGVDIAPSTFFAFLGGTDMVCCGVEEWSEANKATLLGSQRTRSRRARKKLPVRHEVVSE